MKDTMEEGEGRNMKAIEDAVRELGGVWPSDEPTKTRPCKFAHDRYVACDLYVAWVAGGTAKHICTRIEFEECARRLRNEPSFDDHPDAKCFVQNKDGSWSKNTRTAEVEALSYVWIAKGGSSEWITLQQCGEVIGNWRKTLRLRTEEKKMEDENDWHAKGEFPPVGAEFEFSVNGKNWEERVMVFNDGITCLMASRKHPSCRWHYKCDDPELQFHPLKTERERLIHTVLQFIYEKSAGRVSTPTTLIVESLADAGMLKMPEDKQK